GEGCWSCGGQLAAFLGVERCGWGCTAPNQASLFRVCVILQLSLGARAHKRDRQSLQIRARPMKALARIDVLDFDDPLRVTSDGFYRMDAVPAVANEPALDRCRHVSSSVRSPEH